MMVFSTRPTTRSVFSCERLAMAVATQMSLRPLRASSIVLKPVSSVMKRVALCAPPSAERRATSSLVSRTGS